VSLGSDSEAANEPADLDTQLEEILDCVWRQERIWRIQRRIEATLEDKPRRKPPPPKRESTP
jgi:hypothetical protein